MVEGTEFFESSFFAVDDGEVFIQSESLNEAVSHLYSSWFHEVVFAELELGQILVVKVCNFFTHSKSLKMR